MSNWIEIASAVFGFITLQGSLLVGIVKGVSEFGKIDTRLAVLESKAEGWKLPRVRGRAQTAKKR